MSFPVLQVRRWLHGRASHARAIQQSLQHCRVLYVAVPRVGHQGQSEDEGQCRFQFHPAFRHVGSRSSKLRFPQLLSCAVTVTMGLALDPAYAMGDQRYIASPASPEVGVQLAT